MIHLEDAELERFSLQEGDIAVPMDIYLPAGEGEPDITVYSAFLETARDFHRLYGKSPFSDEAFSFLRNRLGPKMARRGFAPSRDACVCIREYRMETSGQLRREWILPDTKIVRREADVAALTNCTTHALFSEEDEEPQRLCTVHTVGDKIAAYAAVNDTSFEDDSVEISVECAPPFRGRGYAASCAALLADTLLSEGCPVRYHCRSANAASRRVAEKTGFHLLGVRCSYVCYRRGM